jgi:flagellar hook-associated protein 1 FlgK
MGLSSAFAAALTGLTASTRRAEVVSSNIANAQTPGYVRRQVELSAQGDRTGQGVQVTTIRRLQDAVLLADRRLANAAAAGADVLVGFLNTAERALGTPEQAGALGGRIDALDAALIAASAQAASDARLAEVAATLDRLITGFREASDQVQAARRAADTRIAAEVTTVNDALAQIAELNDLISAQDAGGRDSAALFDQRQALVDRIASILPVVEVPRDRQRVALYTAQGAMLLDNGPARLGFSAQAGALPGMAMGGLTLNGQPLRTTSDGLIAGGSLSALFDLRDTLVPQAQDRLDRLAADVAGRLAAVDAEGGAGWLTDQGQAVAADAAPGLAGRLTLHARIDPQKGGALWRLRDGLAADLPGPTGNGGLLSRQAQALSDPRPTGGPLSPDSRSASGFAAALLGQTAQLRLGAETRASFAAARAEALVAAEQAQGVDTDAELQELMQVEKAYAANAKVLKTVDDLIALLLEL